MNPLSEKIRLDFRSTEPLYLQIARQLEQLVAQGTLKVGDQLPTVRELAAGLRINFNTVARAYKLLDESGLISTQRGRGTYIWEAPDQEMMAEIRNKSLAELAGRYLAEAHQLGFSTGEALAALQAAAQSPPDAASTTLESSSEEVMRNPEREK